jgi:hypothetical protein
MEHRRIGRIGRAAAIALLIASAAPLSASAATDPRGVDDVPLIFVPGITGSRMEREGHELWPRINDLAAFPRDRFLLDLRLAPDGIHEFDSATPAVATDIVRDKAYKDTITHLEELGYTEGVDLFVFAFDWRKSAMVNAVRLLHFVEETRTCPTCKVDILAHSQGGLVTSWMLLDPESVGKVRRVVTMGTPVLGAAKALGVLEYQTPCFIEGVGVLHVCIVSPSTLQETVTNMPGVYELLPSRAYHRAVESPLTIDPDTRGSGAPPDPKTYDEWTAIVARDRNAALVDQADAFHATIDDFQPRDPNVQMRRVVGMRHETIVRIRQYHWMKCVGGRFAQCHSAITHDLVEGNGDGTVPLNSADMQNLATGFDHRNGIPNRYFDENHLGLATSSKVLSWAVGFLRNGPRIARVATDDDGFDVPATGPALGVDVLGDATATVTDFSGNRLGIDQALQVASDEIPGGSFHAIDTLETFTLSQAGLFTADVIATGGGEIRIRARSYLDSALAGQAVFDLAGQPTGAHFRVALISGQTLADARLQIDADGDGSYEQSNRPTGQVSGPAAAETVPPVTCAGATIASPGVSSVRFAVDDGVGGSGGAATYLRPAGGAETTWGGLPSLLPMFSALEYRSLDNAGNIEDVGNVVLDDAPNCRALADPLADGDHLRRTIAPAGDEDWYRFDANGSATYRVQLIALPADYDLELYDADGRLVDAPYRRSKASEQVRSRLPAGRYYVHVVGFGGAYDFEHEYQLKLQTLGR